MQFMGRPIQCAWIQVEPFDPKDGTIPGERCHWPSKKRSRFCRYHRRLAREGITHKVFGIKTGKEE